MGAWGTRVPQLVHHTHAAVDVIVPVLFVYGRIRQLLAGQGDLVSGGLTRLGSGAAGIAGLEQIPVRLREFPQENLNGQGLAFLIEAQFAFPVFDYGVEHAVLFHQVQMGTHDGEDPFRVMGARFGGCGQDLAIDQQLTMDASRLFTRSSFSARTCA